MARPVTPRIDRVLSKVKITTDCWYWVGSIQTNGYGHFSERIRGVSTGLPAHRAVYEVLVGEIPEGMQIDHLCRNKVCVNPEHLEPTTPRENTMRAGNALATINANKTHCVHGHEFLPMNIYVPPKRPSRRYCRACIKLNLTRKRG